MSLNSEKLDVKLTKHSWNLNGLLFSRGKEGIVTSELLPNDRGKLGYNNDDSVLWLCQFLVSDVTRDLFVVGRCGETGRWQGCLGRSRGKNSSSLARQDPRTRACPDHL